MNFKIFIILFTMFFSDHLAQEISYPSILLSEVPNKISVKNIPNTIDTVNLIVKNGDWQQTFYSKVEGSEANISVFLPSSGKYSFMFFEGGYKTSIKTVMPGWLSIVPPLLAILLALLIRQVIVALFAGIYVGLLFIYEFNPLTALLRLIDTNLFNALIDPDHIYIILFTLLIGGVVGIISKNGGTIGLANQITKLAKTPRSGMIASWFMGIVIFFDDYANSLIIGNMMRPITDKLKVSREKLAYIVDSTAAPIASLVIISTWIGYELGLIGDGLSAINSDQNPYEVFIQTLPYRFYPIAALFFVFITSYWERDFGPMHKAEINARKLKLSEKEVNNQKANIAKSQLSLSKTRWYNGAIPILVILIGTVAGLIFTGINSLESAGIKNYGLDDIIRESDSYKSLLWASLIAGITAVLLTISQGIRKLEETIKAWHSGVQSMMIACIILVMAWGISSITNDLKTADYVISILSDSINPRFLPAIVFVVCGLISFATGTSWGTMAIVMPIVIPMASTITGIEGYSAVDSHIILVGVISSVLAGSVWGDHCSPIADTTILSSMASKCDHIAHVKTQLPYAIMVGLVTLTFGDIPTAFGLSPYISIVLILSVLTGLLFIVGKKVEV
ncbi:MAG: Na+/H+ antiporter NhaC family protein [Ignavibacteriae bacterium]|nr:Na+/H+ antiporter NhaC family protein [Ignavibacteriota bacterium]